MRVHRFIPAAALVLFCTALAAGPAAQGTGTQPAPKPIAAAPAPGDGGYKLPPKVLVDILDAKPLPAVVVSPTRQQLALLDRPSMPSIAEVSQPMLRLAGVRINPRTNGPQRSQGITGITLKAVADGKETKVTAPVGAKIDAVSFSPGGKRLSFFNTKVGGIELWVADAATGAAKAVTMANLNATAGAPCDWVDDASLLCSFVVASRGPAPKAPEVPAGPSVQETSGKPAPVSTYQDLLENAHDEALFEYYFTSQLALVDAATGRRTPLGKPGIYEEASASPSGEYFLVARIKRPFSRLVPLNDFAKDVEVWTKAGQVAKTIADLPLAEAVPMLGVPTGPRNYTWNQLEPATVVWVEALDGGDLRNKVPKRDRVLTMKAPFAGEPAEMLRLDERFQGITWTEGGTALVTELERSKRMRTTWALDPGASTPRKIWQLSAEDRYKDPGRPVMRQRAGKVLVQQAGDVIYLSGEGASSRARARATKRWSRSWLTTAGRC